MPLCISRILHAGYLFESQGFKIAFDPLFEIPFSQNCYAFPSVEFDLKAVQQLELDAIFISHYHDDHFSLESLHHLNRETPIYLFSVFEELLGLLKKLGFKEVHSIEILRPIQIGPFRILPLEALDSEVDSIFHIQAETSNILHVVDSWIGLRTFDRLRETKWDLVLWPFQTMRELEVIAPSIAEKSDQTLPQEWLEQIQELNPHTIIPSSCQFQFENWSWLNQAFFPISYAQFEKQIYEISPKTRVQKLNPGETILQRQKQWIKEGHLSWIKATEDQNLDYTFDPSVKPQPTSEIAKHISALTQKQISFVQNYLQDQLLKRFSSLPFYEGSIFSTTQHWRLKTYRHNGEVQEHQYIIKQNQIHPEALSDEVTWTTEIPETKLYFALTEAESLTSIYIRVIPAKKNDPLEDPLIRCLYEGSVGGYQKAQLKKLGY